MSICILSLESVQAHLSVSLSPSVLWSSQKDEGSPPSVLALEPPCPTEHPHPCPAVSLPDPLTNTLPDTCAGSSGSFRGVRLVLLSLTTLQTQIFTQACSPQESAHPSGWLGEFSRDQRRGTRRRRQAQPFSAHRASCLASVDGTLLCACASC